MLISPSCVDSPGDIIKLTPCPGCDAHISLPIGGRRHRSDVLPQYTRSISTLRSLVLPTGKEQIRFNTTEISSPYTWADIEDTIRLYYNRLDIAPDFSMIDSKIAPSPPPTLTAAASADLVFTNSPVVPSPDSCYKFYTDGSLINLGTSGVSMGWFWVQVTHDAGFFGSIAAYAHGIIKDWPSFSQAEAAAIYAALIVAPPNSTVKT
ncbi:unnamed protein product [Rhizophagus irregularis]|nr:unnamed protein product [Rhizophagus irregularis]